MPHGVFPQIQHEALDIPILRLLNFGVINNACTYRSVAALGGSFVGCLFEMLYNPLMAPSLPPLRAVLWVVASFCVAMLAIYGTSLRNGFVTFDDGMLITDNSAIREITPASLKAIFTHYDPELYIPLTFFSYQLDFQLGGEQPFIFHLDNLLLLLLHTINALLVCWLFYLLSFGRKDLALVAGIIFAAHPIQTEAVAWAAARKDVLSSLFFLLSLIGYLYYRSEENRRFYWWSIVAFLLGLLAKVSVIMLPAVLFLLDWREGRRWGRTMLLEKVPYVVLCVLFGIIAIFGKTDLLSKTSLWTKALLACRSSVFYLQKFFWPSGFSVLYPYDGPVSLAATGFLLSMVVLVLLLFSALWTIRWTKEIAFGLAFYFVMLLPTFTNLAKNGDIYLASDRYAYLPNIGILWGYSLACNGTMAELGASPCRTMAQNNRDRRGRCFRRFSWLASSRAIPDMARRGDAFPQCPRLLSQ